VDEGLYSPNYNNYSPPENTQQITSTTEVGQENIQQHENHEGFQNYEQNNNNNTDIADVNIDTANDDISIKGTYDTYVTINDISIVREMNSARLNINPETGEERDGEAINNTPIQSKAKAYNEKPEIYTCPNQQSAQYAKDTCAHNDDTIKC